MSNEIEKHAGRRAFLKGVGGAAIALPLLEYTHGEAFAQTGSPLRFLTFFHHGGTLTNQGKRSRHDGTGNHHGMDYWTPAAGEDLALNMIQEPIAHHRDRLTVLTGVDNAAAIRQDRYGAGAHGTANASALSAAVVETYTDSGGKERQRSTASSIDHVLAEHLLASQAVPFARMHLTVHGHQYGTPHYDGSSGTGGIKSPREAFDTYFAGLTADPDDEAAQRARLRRRSILDGVMEGLARFRGRVSTRDRVTIDGHLEHLRALEREIDALDVAGPMCVAPGAPTADGAQRIAEVHAELIVAAMRCGLTNVACLEMADLVTPWTPAGSPTNPAYGIGHALHHMARDIGPTGELAGIYDDWMAEMLDNRRWRMEILARILDGLADPELSAEGAGTILDNSLLMVTSEFSNGSQHSAHNVPLLFAGSAGGQLRTGRHLNFELGTEGTYGYDTETSTHNVFTSIVQAFGMDVDHFGSDHAYYSGPVPGLFG